MMLLEVHSVGITLLASLTLETGALIKLQLIKLKQRIATKINARSIAKLPVITIALLPIFTTALNQQRSLKLLY